MDNLLKELTILWDEHEGNVRSILENNKNPYYYYALSDQRELLLEWYEFKNDSKLLQIGADFGAMTGLFCDRVEEVVVLEEDEDQIQFIKRRYSRRHNLRVEKQTTEQFDYIIITGNTCNGLEEQIALAKALLTPEGVLILAVENSLGIKFLGGTPKEEVSYTKAELENLVGGDGRSTFYYPMPDYKTPMTIFSDNYLPQRGELGRVIHGFDFPKYYSVDWGDSIEHAVSSGNFPIIANSYLMFWSQNQLCQNDYIYAKYNKTRREEFQIRTGMKRVENGIEVEKEALNLAGMGHINHFPIVYEKLSTQQTQLKVVKPKSVQEKNAVSFPFLEGKPLVTSLIESIEYGCIKSGKVYDALNLIFEVKEGYVSSFYETEEFVEVFGKFLTKEQIDVLRVDVSLRTTNIDALFDNILIAPDGNYALDYEWVYEFPIPKGFVTYRILYYFYEHNKSILTNYGDCKVFLTAFSVPEQMHTIYQQMEESFQIHVHGENRKFYLDNYAVDAKDRNQIRNMEEQLGAEIQRVQQLKQFTKEKDQNIRKITEVQRLTNNHVTNLENIISSLRSEVAEKDLLIQKLHKHESLLYKVWRKLGRKFNERYPKGSLKRKKMLIRKEYLTNPFHAMKFYATPEGKNRKDGYYDIGDEYLEHGKLKFQVQEKPQVSIVIPVYNQIHYTYACLRSILKNTKDVSYEIIIADDVSSDATIRLSEFAEGIVIARNSTNQGFLRNCNQAAAKAKGNYIMFLNNDTQVKEGWLSSLVQLLESDSRIGMVGSKLVYPSGQLQEAGGIIWSDGSGWNYGRMDDPEKPEYNYVKEVDYISGAALMIPTILWKQIGGFDTRFAPAYCEDSDLAFEVRKAGYRVVYQPKSEVIHYEGISNGTDVEGSGLKRYQVVNNKKLVEKWKTQLENHSENTGNPDPFRARERSQGKKIILFVDHYVPTFDKDAGSKTTFQYLSMLISKGYVIKFLGDNFAKEEPYSTILQQMGIEILYGSYYQVNIWDWIREHEADIAVAYLNRPHIASKYVDYILDHTNIKVIYYGHDLHFLREMREYELTQNLTRLEESEAWKATELGLMKKASVSYYPSYIERDAIRQIDPTIKVKDIVAYVYEHYLENLNDDFSKRKGLLFVGGFAHTPNIDAVLWFVKDIYPKIKEIMGDNTPKFHIVGSKAPEEITSLGTSDSNIVVEGFVSDERLMELYLEMKVAVVPLRYGAGVKGKVVEAIYHGIPIVTTGIGAEGIPRGEEVLCVKDEEWDFANAVAALYEDEEQCKELLCRSQNHIKQYYSMEAAWNVIKDDFEG